MRNAGCKIDRIYRRLCQQRVKGKRDNGEKIKEEFLFLRLHKLLLFACFSQLTNDSTTIFFVSFFCVTQKEVENENKSTVNNRTRCQLPYQINLASVEAALEE